MYLHDEREVFRELIVETGKHLGIKKVIVEKDYYVTIILLFHRRINSAQGKYR